MNCCFVFVFLILWCLSGTHSPFFTFSVRAVITPVCLLGLAVVWPTDTNKHLGNRSYYCIDLVFDCIILPVCGERFYLLWWGWGGWGGGSGLTRMDHSFVDGEKVKRKKPMVRVDVRRRLQSANWPGMGGNSPSHCNNSNTLILEGGYPPFLNVLIHFSFLSPCTYHSHPGMVLVSPN